MDLDLNESMKQNVNDAWVSCEHLLQEANIDIDVSLKPQAIRVFTQSNFVLKQCLKSTTLLMELILDDRFNQHLSHHEFRDKLHIKITSASDIGSLKISKNDWMRALREFRNQQMVAIYWRDLLELASVEETCDQASMLADVCIQETENYLYQALTLEYDVHFEKNDNSEVANHLLVLGMGKLGGQELNVSSDVDLIFCYCDEYQLISNNSSWDAERFYLRLSRELIQMLDQVTQDGFVYRVDMRLRPYGDSGPLVMSLSAIEEYYQDQGRDWERFALIKSRCITGSDEQQTLLRSLLKPFVYRRYIDFSVLDSPRQMKKLIDQELRRKNLTENIKLGAGGIREVEFIAQALQLIHGGRHSELQCRSLFDSFPRLVKANLLTQEVVDVLLTNYLYLRKIEHRLQARRDEQTQTLPQDPVEQQILSSSLNFNSWHDFVSDLKIKMANIHDHFEQQFQDHSEPTNLKVEQPFVNFWDELDAFAAASNKELTTKLKFGDSHQSVVDALGNNIETLIQFRNSSMVRHMGVRGAKRLKHLMPKVLEFVSVGSNQTETLSRILKLLTAVLKRTAYLELLTENNGALQQMLLLCAKSSRIAEQIADYPYVLDELISPEALNHPPIVSDYADTLRQMMSRIPEDDIESQLDALREFHQSNLLRVTAADIAGVLTVDELSQQLSGIAEAVINQVYSQSMVQLAQKHGVPTSSNFAIIAYGKLGGLELGYGSDLDLVFLHNAKDGLTSGEKPIENSLFYLRLAQKIIHLLSIRTRSGVLYEVDMRLRPSGNSGLLVSHIDAFCEYQRESAWTWEHQALVRARCILGEDPLQQQFSRIRHDVICKKRGEKLNKEVIDMRAKMRQSLLGKSAVNVNTADEWFDLKQSRGGIADIEFLIQFLVLKYAHSYPELTKTTNTNRLISFLTKNTEIGFTGSANNSSSELKEIYSQLLKRVNQRALQNQSSLVLKSSVSDISIERVIELWVDYLGDTV